MIEHRRYGLVAHFFREEGFDGWVALILHLNLVTQGSTLAEALSMAVDAAEEIIADDISHGLDPFERLSPPEDWHLAFASGGTNVPLDEVLKDDSKYSKVVVDIYARVAVEIDEQSGQVIGACLPAQLSTAATNDDASKQALNVQRCA